MLIFVRMLCMHYMFTHHRTVFLLYVCMAVTLSGHCTALKNCIQMCVCVLYKTVMAVRRNGYCNAGLPKWYIYRCVYVCYRTVMFVNNPVFSAGSIQFLIQQHSQCCEFLICIIIWRRVFSSHEHSNPYTGVDVPIQTK